MLDAGVSGGQGDLVVVFVFGRRRANDVRRRDHLPHSDHSAARAFQVLPDAISAHSKELVEASLLSRLSMTDPSTCVGGITISKVSL